MSTPDSEQQADPDSNREGHYEAHRVQIVEIDIPFASLAAFMIKFAVAATLALLFIASILGGLYVIIVVIWLFGTNPFS